MCPFFNILIFFCLLFYVYLNEYTSSIDIEKKYISIEEAAYPLDPIAFNWEEIQTLGCIFSPSEGFYWNKSFFSAITDTRNLIFCTNHTLIDLSFIKEAEKNDSLLSYYVSSDYSAVIKKPCNFKTEFNGSISIYHKNILLCTKKLYGSCHF
ncbi:MAG: hypothetical protein JNM36_08530 [Chitinophagales bacterium]|nr:hypothetical protein [Chitinophagales bacterium]